MIDFAEPGANSALRAATETNPRNIKCPTCGHPDRLTPADVERGYQCDRCADAFEKGWEIDYYEPEPSQLLGETRLVSEDDESYANAMLYKVDVNLSDEEIDEWVADEFGEERCQHEYDCCGRYYARKGKWGRIDETTICITQMFYLNV